MELKFYDFNDKPAYTLPSGVIPLVLQYSGDGEQEWVPYYEVRFGLEAMRISEKEFRELAGDMAEHMPNKIWPRSNDAI